VLARLAVALSGVLLTLPAAAAADAYFAVRGAPAPGPAKYNRVWVDQIGPASASHVLVLVPGTGGAAGSLTFAGRDIQAALGADWQIWIEDRREVAFQDTSGFRSGDPATASKYYLGFKYKSVRGANVPFTRQWGLTVAMNDLQRVVAKARDGGKRKVVLGGHSLGASEAVTYAAWDFAGRAGYRDLAGIVLIDGGELGAFFPAGNQLTLETVKARKRSIDKGESFDDILRLGIPSIAPIFAQVAGLYAAKQPDAASALQPNPLVPARLRPPFTVTNAAFLGNTFDKDHAPAGFEALRIRAGDFAADGDPRPWVDGENTPIGRFAAAMTQVRPTFAEWYFPRRLSLDVFAADSMKPDMLTNFLGLRLWHTPQIDVPLYAYQTDLTQGGVIKGAQALKAASGIQRVVTIDDSADASHLDPVVAPPATNRFTQTVVPFLQSLG
jgi:pimeloyl-ACP methyl ester carboxylesterase